MKNLLLNTVLCWLNHQQAQQQQNMLNRLENQRNILNILFSFIILFHFVVCFMLLNREVQTYFTIVVGFVGGGLLVSPLSPNNKSKEITRQRKTKKRNKQTNRHYLMDLVKED
jgi:hypothetical protein